MKPAGRDARLIKVDRRVFAALALSLGLVLGTSPAQADAGIPAFADESALLAGTPATDDGAPAAVQNPAQWGLLERSEAAFWLSDHRTIGPRREDYGFAVGRGLGVSYRHRIALSPKGWRGVGDYQIGAGWGDRERGAGIAYGFSGPGRSAFARKNFLALGSIHRPTPWLSFGSTGRIASGESEGLLDLGLRPLSDARVTLFGQYAIRSGARLEDGDRAAGALLRPVGGLEIGGRWSRNDRFQLTLGVTLHRAGFRAMTRYRDQDRGATNYMVRLDPPVRGLDPAGALLRRRLVLKMDLKGTPVYQSYRLFDEGSIPLRSLLENLDLALRDPTVGGVAINLSGFDPNVEMAWEVREKLVAIRDAGKHVIVYADRMRLTDYYLASAADHLVMDPAGSLLAPGVQASRTYMKDALDKLKLGFDEWRFLKYKSAMETFSRRDMSEADREQYEALVRDRYEELASGIIRSGRMTRAAFDSVVNAEPYLSAQRLLELRWIDEIGGPDVLEAAARKAAGHAVRLTSARRLRELRWQPNETWGREPTIALVYAIGDCAMDTGIRGRDLAKELKRLRERRDVKAVVLRVDSPGGDPLPSDLVARELRMFRAKGKPVYVSQGRVAASGGYWISMDAARIDASPFTLTGSIGVIGGWVWNRGFGEKLGLTSDRVQVGKSADLLGGVTIPFVGVTIPERNLDEREREVAKRSILELYDGFTKRVAEGRKIPLERVREIAEGRVYSGRAALPLQLVDGLVPLDRTLLEARRAAGLGEKRRVRIEEWPRRRLLSLPWFLRGPQAAVSGEATGSAPTYAQRWLDHMVRNPGVPLLLVPSGLLPDEPAAR